MNIYTDFLSLDEIKFLTGRKQPSRMIETLNKMGIPFITNAHGTPIVRRDYAAPKPKQNNPNLANGDFIMPNVMKSI